MAFSSLFLLLIAIGALFYFAGKRRVDHARAAGQTFHSLPNYHGLWTGLLALVPATLVLLVWSIVDIQLFQHWVRDFYPAEVLAAGGSQEVVALAKVENLVAGVRFGEPEAWLVQASDAWMTWSSTSTWLKSLFVIGLALGCGLFSYRQISPNFRARNGVERIIAGALIVASTIAILTTLGIVVSVLFETIRFFKLVPPTEFIFGTEWNPQFEGAERAGSGGGTAVYGMLPMFVGTFLISTVALVVAVPVGLASAIYLAEYAKPKTRATIKPLLEILAGVPTVVYGFFAALTVAPMIKNIGEALGLTVASESALAAGLVMGVMIIPFISSLADDVINSVPQSLRDAAYGLGSTKSEATRQVVLPAALPGIVAAIILAVSRAVGETMIVVMAAGLAANLSFNPLDAVTTVTSQIVTILVGDQEFESAKTLSAFALSTMLIILTLGLNFFALQIVKKYREQYD
ncbi:MAG TPA: phosphate ABC transporter permease subunit PstC [Marinobacterium sp.]|nr:phosphate ABC transporter permease subunit PstC [Marinobacterium sp.]